MNYTYSQYFFKIKQDLNVYTNLNSILEKLENEGNLKKIENTIKKIMKNEIVFTISELKKMKEKKRKIEISNELIINTLMFKENLKLISNSLIDAIWNEKVKKENINETMKIAYKEMYKGNFEEIKEEVEEENGLYSSSPDYSDNLNFKSPKKKKRKLEILKLNNSLEDNNNKKKIDKDLDNDLKKNKRFFEINKNDVDNNEKVKEKLKEKVKEKDIIIHIPTFKNKSIKRNKYFSAKNSLDISHEKVGKKKKNKKKIKKKKSFNMLGNNYKKTKNKINILLKNFEEQNKNQVLKNIFRKSTKEIPKKSTKNSKKKNASKEKRKNIKKFNKIFFIEKKSSEESCFENNDFRIDKNASLKFLHDGLKLRYKHSKKNLSLSLEKKIKNKSSGNIQILKPRKTKIKKKKTN